MRKRHFSNQRGPQTTHNVAQAVRAHLGLTQDDLAALMEVSRAAVSMDEHGTRDLPWPQAELLQALFRALPAAETLPLAVPETLTAADRDELDFRRQGLRLQLLPLKRRLARQQVQLAQARCWQQVLPAVRTAFPAANAHAHDWLNRFERRAALQREEAGVPVLLQVRVQALEGEIAEITRLLGDGEAPAA